MPDPSTMHPKQRAMFEKIQRASPQERKSLMDQIEQMMGNFGGGSSSGGYGGGPGGVGADDGIETVNLDGPQVTSGGQEDYDML